MAVKWVIAAVAALALAILIVFIASRPSSDQKLYDGFLELSRYDARVYPQEFCDDGSLRNIRSHISDAIADGEEIRAIPSQAHADACIEVGLFRGMQYSPYHD